MTRPECARCGQVHERCTGHRRDGNPCNTYPIAGLDKCRMHCGKTTKTAVAEGQRNLALAEVAASLSDVVVTPITDPLQALADVAAEAVAAKNHFANLVAELDKHMAFETRFGEQKLDARVGLYERALDRCERFLSNWVRLGFDERKAQLDDARAALIRTVLVGVLTDLGHQLDDAPVRGSLERWLPVLDGRPPPTIDVT